MAGAHGSDVTVGRIIGETVNQTAENLIPGAIFVAVLTVAGSIAEWIMLRGDEAPPIAPVLQLAVAGLSFFGMYLLLEFMLRMSGQHSYEGPRRFLGYLGQSIVIGLCFVLGLILLILPGLVVMARWSLAQPLLVGRGVGAMDAVGMSWKMTAGHTTQIVVAILVLLVAIGVPTFLITFAFYDDSLFMIVLAQLLTNSLTVIGTAFVSALMLLIEPDAGYSEVFA